MYRKAEYKEHRSRLFLICCYCGKHKNCTGLWEHVDEFYHELLELRISHGICPECLRKHFPEEYIALCAEKKARACMHSEG